MRNPLERRRSAAMAVPLMVLAALATAACAEPAPVAGTMAFWAVMDTLGRDLQAVTGAISREDWAAVAALAPRIASHGEVPGAEMSRSHEWLGAGAEAFEGFDHRAHEAATVMGQAAGRADGPAVIAAFAEVQQGCLGCHQRFRQPFQEYFYRSP